MSTSCNCKITDDNDKIFLPIRNGLWRENFLQIKFPDGRWLEAECEDYIPKPKGMNDFPYKETFDSNNFKIIDYGFGKAKLQDDGSTIVTFEGGWMIDWDDDGELLYSDFQFVHEPCVKGYFIMVYEFRKRDNYEYRLIIGDSRTGKAYKFDFEDTINKENRIITKDNEKLFEELIQELKNRCHP